MGMRRKKLVRWGEGEGEGGAKVRTPLPQCGSVSALQRGRVAGSRIPLIENTAGAAPKTKKDEKMEEEDGGKRSGRCGISFSLKVSFFSKKNTCPTHFASIEIRLILRIFCASHCGICAERFPLQFSVEGRRKICLDSISPGEKSHISRKKVPAKAHHSSLKGN